MVAKHLASIVHSSAEAKIGNDDSIRPMRILFAALDAPFPVTSGRRLRNWALLKALAEEGHEITLVYFNEPGVSTEAAAELRQVCRNVDVMPYPDVSGGSHLEYWNRVRALISRLPYGAWRLRSKQFQIRIQEWLARTHFDFLVCDEIFVAANLPARPAVPVVLDKMGLGTVVLERFLSNERNPVKKLYGQMELTKTRRWEATVCHQAAMVMACSEQDRSEIERLSPGAEVMIIPNVIDVREYEPGPCVDNHTVVFVAYMGWYPNQDAVEFFVSSILPKLRILVPDVKFLVAGRNPPDDFRRRLSKVSGVEFTGSVPDIRPVIANSAVCVVPLRIATGTRLKVLEAAAMEKAVVSTTIGAEGLDFADGAEIVLADDSDTFARKIAELFASPSHARAIGAAARCRVQESYSIDTVRVALRQMLAEIAKKIGKETEACA